MGVELAVVAVRRKRLVSMPVKAGAALANPARVVDACSPNVDCTRIVAWVRESVVLKETSVNLDMS